MSAPRGIALHRDVRGGCDADRPSAYRGELPLQLLGILLELKDARHAYARIPRYVVGGEPPEALVHRNVNLHALALDHDIHARSAIDERQKPSGAHDAPAVVVQEVSRVLVGIAVEFGPPHADGVRQGSASHAPDNRAREASESVAPRREAGRLHHVAGLGGRVRGVHLQRGLPVREPQEASGTRVGDDPLHVPAVKVHAVRRIRKYRVERGERLCERIARLAHDFDVGRGKGPEKHSYELAPDVEHAHRDALKAQLRVYERGPVGCACRHLGVERTVRRREGKPHVSLRGGLRDGREHSRESDARVVLRAPVEVAETHLGRGREDSVRNDLDVAGDEPGREGELRLAAAQRDPVAWREGRRRLLPVAASRLLRSGEPHRPSVRLYGDDACIRLVARHERDLSRHAADGGEHGECGRHAIMPLCIPSATASARSLTLRLERMLFTCVFTVLRLRCTMSAISSLEYPLAM